MHAFPSIEIIHCILFVQINAGIVRDLATGTATAATKAFVLVISNPVNSTVPIVAEIFKEHGVFNPKRLACHKRIYSASIDCFLCRILGVTTLDVVRASTFVAEIMGESAAALHVEVHGARIQNLAPLISSLSSPSSDHQIIPLISQSSHPLPPSISEDQHAALIKRIQFSGDEVVQAKDGPGSATPSITYAGAELCSNVLQAAGKKVSIGFVHLSADKAGGERLGLPSLMIIDTL